MIYWRHVALLFAVPMLLMTAACSSGDKYNGSGSTTNITPTSWGEEPTVQFILVTPSPSKGGNPGEGDLNAPPKTATIAGGEDVRSFIEFEGCKTVSPTQAASGRNPTAKTCIYGFEFPLRRPINPPGRDFIEPSYRYGSTQGGTREPHHGVEFINSAGVPVLAAADGVVLAAGSDQEKIFADKYDFYGRLVVLKHEVPGLDPALYTLYGHLLEVMVQPGQKVRAGQAIGKVGAGGVASGTHLHFEVRLGENDYNSTRNPELWLEPHLDEQGQAHGAIAGRILDMQKNFLAMPNIVVRQLSTDRQKVISTIYLTTYEEKGMIGTDPWEENFAVGDLPAGWYRLTFIYRRPQEYEVQVLPQKVTVVYLIGN